MTDALDEAEGLLHASKSGVLSTLSKRAEGWPFGSLVPYAVSRRSEPIILIARIAEHTKNIEADSRVSLLVHEPLGEEVQARGRLTIMGHARPIAAPEVEDAAARYLARVKDAAGYLGTHDFRFYSVSLERLRYIGGFGKIHWLEPDGWIERKDPLADAAPGILAHMNADHADALRLMIRAFAALETTHARMIGVDAFGFDVATDARRVRLEFAERATPENIRRLMVAMTTEARRATAT